MPAPAPHARRNAPTTRPTAIEYPESDGRPVAETPIHYHAIYDAMAPLGDRYRERADVFVAGNMMMYYEPGKPRRFVSPDVFVAFDVRPIRGDRSGRRGRKASSRISCWR